MQGPPTKFAPQVPEEPAETFVQRFRKALGLKPDQPPTDPPPMEGPPLSVYARLAASGSLVRGKDRKAAHAGQHMKARTRKRREREARAEARRARR